MGITVSRCDVGTIKMSTNPPKEVVNAGFRIIHDNVIKCWVGIGWVEERPAEREDFLNIPQLID